MSGNAFCSCSLDVFLSIPVRETVRESSESGESPDVRFPPPPPKNKKDRGSLAVSAEWVSRDLSRTPVPDTNRELAEVAALVSLGPLGDPTDSGRAHRDSDARAQDLDFEDPKIYCKEQARPKPGLFL